MEQTEYFEEERKKILQEFEEKFNGGQFDLDPEFLEIVNENFWDIIEGM